MFRVILLFLTVSCFVVSSCTKDIVSNDPALQGQFDGEDFKSSIKQASIYDDGTLVIKGTDGNKSISFTIASLNKGTYKMSQAVSQVSFQKEQAKFLVQDGETAGEVIITEIYDNKISGRFYFKNLKDSNGNISNFNNGLFYRLPITNGSFEDTEDINPCLKNASLTAVVDGSPLETTNHSAVEFGASNNISSIRITAVNLDSAIEIVFPINAAPGSYSLTGSGEYSATYTFKRDKSSTLNGTLVIQNHDIENKCISGTFEYETRSGIQF